MSNLFNSFHTQEVSVFFDESGKESDRPNLLGSLSIPKKIYEQSEIQTMNNNLRANQFKIHWKNYNGNSFVKGKIVELVELFIRYEEFMKFNVIDYHYGFLKDQQSFTKQDRDMTIYSKFPERLIYGLIRGYGSETHVVANIFIDKSTEYEKLKLNETLISTLNSQSLYRGEKFYAEDCVMLPKNSEIGLELIDVLLGIIRTIIKNPHVTDMTSKVERAKVFLTTELLNDVELKRVLSEIKYFEWRGNPRLTQINFLDYIHAFLIQQIY